MAVTRDEQGAVPRPIVTAKRLDTSVEFRWRAADKPRAGDSFQWRFPRRGGTHSRPDRRSR
jgi:hypothetical protein